MATDRQDPEDHHLLQRTARGEEDALAALYAKYATPVYSLARFMLGQPALAEEATQDIFLNIWLKAASDSKRSRRGSGDQGIQHKQFCLGEFHRTGGRQGGLDQPGRGASHHHRGNSRRPRRRLGQRRPRTGKPVHFHL